MTDAELAPLGPRGPVAGGRDLAVPGDGVRLAATRWQGTGPPVLLLHGLASQRRFWNLVVPGLAGLPVVALDQRGHGDSERPETGYDEATVVRDLTTALDALGLSRVVVVGHSWGAMVALAFAARHPERALAVVAVDGGITSVAQRWSREEARVALAPPRFALAPEELRSRLRDTWIAAFWSPEVEDAALPIFGVGPNGLARARLPFDRHMQVVDALYDYDPAMTLGAVRAPCWLVSALPLPEDEPDQEWRDHWEAATARAATALHRPHLIRVQPAVHDLPLQHPALVAGIVRAAVAEAAAPGADEGSP